MRKFLEKYLRIYVHESSRFLWITAIFFVIFFVTAIFRNYVDAAFLKRYGPQYIPWMLVINGLLTFAVMGIVDRLGRRSSDYALLCVFLFGYAGSTIALFFVVKAGFSIAYPILYQLLYLLDTILLVYLWNMAGDLFDTRQGKRIFPLITAGQVLGSTLGSFATSPFTRSFGEDPALLVFGVASFGTAIFVARTASGLLGKSAERAGAAKSPSRIVRLTEVPGLIKHYPIVRYLMVAGLIPNVLLPIFLYQFNVIANHTFTSEQALISFLSVFRGMTTLSTFVLLFFMGRLYSSMGLTNASLVHPVNFAVLFGSLSAFFNIYVACYGQFTAILIQRAISGPVTKVLYNIIPAELMAWSRTFIRGTVVKVGMLAGSLLMIAVKPVMDAKDLSYIALALAIYWILETLFFRKHYRRILKQVIVEKQIDFDQIESVRAFDSGGAAMEVGPVAVEDRVEVETALPEVRKLSEEEIDVALKLLSDESPRTRAEAAVSLAGADDIRAVRKLILLLDDPDDDVRKAAIEALMSYKENILPFLEVSLSQADHLGKRSILEVIRLAGLKDFELIPFVGMELKDAYANLVAIRGLERLNKSTSVEMLKQRLTELNEETLSLIFYALWVYYADMRLLYQALKSESSSIAVEMVETSVQKEIGPYLIPLIDDIPIAEKIDHGKKLFPLMRSETIERVLTNLADSGDTVTRMLALFVIGEEHPRQTFIPIIERRLDDESASVRELAQYALRRTMNEVAPMPNIIEKLNVLKGFSIFEGMGIRELHAIASVLTVERYEPGYVIIKEGETNSSIYLIVGGKVTIYDKYETPEQREKITLGEGAFLGELSLFSQMPPNATCIAASDVDAYVLRHHQFQEIMRVYPQIGINLCRFFTVKLRQLAY
jgi:HEAT repeat protein/ATP/ADP translocase